MYHVLQTTSILNKKGFLLTADVEKAFDSVDHSFYELFFRSMVLGSVSKMNSKSN